MGSLLDYGDRHGGTFPKTRKLTGFTEAELRDVQMTVQRHHWGRRGGEFIFLTERYIGDEWGSPERFREHAAGWLGRPLLDLAADKATAQARLREALASTQLPDALRDHMARFD